MTSDCIRVASIRVALQKALQPLHLQIEDESAQHVGHAGAASGGGHFSLYIVAACFTEQPLVARHRMVYAAVRELLAKDIHALRIEAKSPAEAGIA